MNDQTQPPYPPYFGGEYLITTTLWSAFVPGHLFTIPFCLYCCLSDPNFDFCAANPLAVFWLLFGLAIALLYYRFFRYSFRRFAYNLQTGNVPKHFILRIVPFYIPLLYWIFLTVYGFLLSNPPGDPLTDFMTLSLGNIFYFGWFMPLTVMTYQHLGWTNPHYTNAMFIHIPMIICSVALLTAVIGTIYTMLYYKKPHV